VNSISTKDSSSISTDPTFANVGPGTYRISEGGLSLQNLAPTNVGAVKESINNGDSLTSTNYSTNVNLKELVPIKSYENAELFKETILKESRNQSGIYRWVNNLNIWQKSYVGSGIDLAKRLRSYYNKNELNRNPRPIKDALVKYGHNNFTLDILEYCSIPGLLEREQFYIDLLSPEYNILKFAYSLLGFRHSPENLEKFKSKIISPEHKEILSLAHKGKLVSQETRNKLAVATANYKKNNPLSPEALANIKSKTLEREGVSVTVLNTQTNEVREFTSQTEAGEFLGVTRQAMGASTRDG
jgi:group I intron endonuclease